MAPVSVAVAVTEPSHAAEARRAAGRIAARLGFDESAAGRVALVATEAATNLVKHTRGGEVVVQPVALEDAVGLEILALDQGPGMRNVAASLRDGYSTAGSPGTGLGAIARLASRFDIYSAPGVGTAVLARLWCREPAHRPGARLDVGGVCLACPGETVCGDGWAVQEQGACTVVMLADGLGHGEPAADAAGQAIRAFGGTRNGAPARIVGTLHQALRSTRGAAVGVAEVDLGRSLVTYCGVGNIAGLLLGAAGARHLASHNGTAGHEARKIDEFRYPWPEGGLLVLHSDGLTTHWSLDRYPGLSSRDPSLIAGVLYRDFARRRDDVTVVVAREAQR